MRFAFTTNGPRRSSTKASTSPARFTPLPRIPSYSRNIRNISRSAWKKSASNETRSDGGTTMADSLAREITRRGFLVNIGQGLAAPNVAGTFIHNTAAQQFVPDPPGKKLGWAIVGLG